MADLSDDDLSRIASTVHAKTMGDAAMSFARAAIEADRALNARAAEPVGPNAPWGDMRQWAINMAKAEADAGDPDMTAGCSACVTCGQPWSAQPAPVGAEGLPDERSAFEDLADDQGFTLTRAMQDDDYQDLRTQVAWDFWRARAALASRPVGDGGADTERLNWLESSSWYVGPGGFYCDEAGGMQDYCDENAGPGTIRLAIDAARTAGTAPAAGDGGGVMPRYIAAEDKPAKPLTNDDGTLHQFTLRIAGKPYRCPCRCNVFHKPDRTKLDLYECNCCGQQFEAA